MKICIQAYFWMLKTMTRSIFEFLLNISSTNAVFADQIWANLGKYFETACAISKNYDRNDAIIEEISVNLSKLGQIFLTC